MGALVERGRAVLFFNDPATTEIYTLSLHDALPISLRGPRPPARPERPSAAESGDGLSRWSESTCKARPYFGVPFRSTTTRRLGARHSMSAFRSALPPTLSGQCLTWLVLPEPRVSIFDASKPFETRDRKSTR